MNWSTLMDNDGINSCFCGRMLAEVRLWKMTTATADMRSRRLVSSSAGIDSGQPQSRADCSDLPAVSSAGLRTIRTPPCQQRYKVRLNSYSVNALSNSCYPVIQFKPFHCHCQETIKLALQEWKSFEMMA